MTPDEHICTTCEGEGAVVWQLDYVWPADEDAIDCVRNCRHWDDAWQVDACPECGRGGEVGRL